MITTLDIPKSTTIISNEDIPKDPEYQDLRVLRCQTDEVARKNYQNKAYEFQHDLGHRFLKATLTRKGVLGQEPRKDRIVAFLHLSLKDFVDLVRYDPSNPPIDHYDSLEMLKAHKQTQSDFKGQKMKNKELFKTYLLEGVQGNMELYLPPVAGWQSSKVFDRTLFVAFDESDPNALYGFLYLPTAPIMQADGQTQTAALFGLANTKEASLGNFLTNLMVTLEIELNVNEQKAGNSFAIRNGRGSKKNKNLVIGLDQSSALSELRKRAVDGTIFEKRIADGRTIGATKTSTGPIADLSTVEQMLLAIIFGNYQAKPERVKHYHIDAFEPYAREFFHLLDRVFGKQWPEKTPADSEPFRYLYVHGWAFAQKAIAEAYYESRKDKIKPLTDAMSVKDASKTEKEAYKDAVIAAQDGNGPTPAISFDELTSRLQQIDWHRYRKHWVKITGYKQKKDGSKARVALKSEKGMEVVVATAQNTPGDVAAVKNKILSNSWHELTSSENEPVD